MKQFEMNKSLLDNLYGLSCIENYFLYALSIENYAYKYLYYNSAVSLRDIADAFFVKNAQYAYFNKIPRLHREAIDNKLISMVNFDGANLDLYVLEKDFVCVKVIPEFIESKYRTELWRDDHYILLSYLDNNNFKYLNDNPKDQGIISKAELRKFYGGHIIGFDILREINDELKAEFLKLFLSALTIDFISSDLVLHDIIKARDTLGVLRISRKRIFDYYLLYINEDFAVDYLQELDKQYAVLEYMRLRKNIDIHKMNDIFVAIQEYDNVMINAVRMQMAIIVEKL